MENLESSRRPEHGDAPAPARGAGHRRAPHVAVLVLLALTLAAAGWGEPAAAAGARVAVITVAVARLRRRAREGGSESLVWTWFTRAALAVWLGALVQTVLVLAAPRAAGAVGAAGREGVAWGDAAVSLASLAACILLYQGLIVWNRVSTKVAAPGDWLNGISAALAVAALVHLVIAWRSPAWHGTSWWALNLSVARFSALFIVLGTALTVAFMAGLLRDVRPWAVAVAVVCSMGAEVLTTAATVPASWLASSWAAFAVVLAWAAHLRPHPVRPQAATTQALTIGTFVVLLAGLAILFLDTRLPPALTWPSSVCAGLAVIGVSTRVVRLIGDLATLAQTRQEALTDDLTGLANRRAFTLELDRVSRGGSDVAVLLLDLDRFKEVNDRYGHDVGDQLLKRTAQQLDAAVPSGALLARLGGDEFAVLLAPGDDRHALEVARELAAAGRGGGEPGGPPHVGASVGVATSGSAPGPRRPDGGELLRQADAAMYVAKDSPGHVSFYDDALDRAGLRAALMADELAEALDPAGPGSPFRLHYQPQLDLRSGAVVGVEALVRWQHPDLGLLAPDAFLDLVERTGRMGALTGFVLAEAARQSSRWCAGGLHLRVAVNLSASSLSDPELLVVLDHLVGEGLVPSSVVLEVTETVLMADPVLALATMRELRLRGFELSIDDYGTGYSSLAYLADLPATEVKLDRSFTARLLSDERVGHIVAGTVALAHRLGLRVVAEGVEDGETLRALDALGVDETQGYLHSRPLDTSAVTAWIRAHQRDRDPGRVATHQPG